MGEFVDLLPDIRKREDEDLKRFADFLFFNGIEKVTIIDKPDETRKKKTHKGNFDYLIQLSSHEKMALEFTQIFEKEEDRIMSMQWGNLVGAFREELRSYLSKHGKFSWTGVWNIETPENFGANRSKSRNIAQKNVGLLINAIERGKSSFEVAGFVLRIKKVVEQPLGDLFFSTSSGVKGIDPSSEVEPKLREKLPEKDEQLAVKGATRVLIIVNKYIFGETSEVISALARIKDIWDYENIDILYFEESPGHFVLIFSEELRNAWNSKSFPIDNSFIGPFQLWIPNLRNINPERTFLIVRKILSEQGKRPYQLFPDNFAREEITQLDNWLIDQKRFDDVIWLVNEFLDDPDPEDPENYTGTPQLNYHEQIVKGEDPHVITTVAGRLAWAIQKLAMYQDHIAEALNYTKKLLSRKNLYVKLQAIVPLIEIAKRRQWLDGYGKRPYQGTYKEFHGVAFDLVKLLRDHPNYNALAKLLSDVFAFYKDLSTQEAEQVLDALKITDESAGLFVYYAIFRQRHFQDQPIKFDGETLAKELKEMILNNDEKYQRLHASIAWNFWRVLDKHRDEFDIIRPYIDLILEQPYQKHTCDHVEFIIKDWIKDRPGVCVQWYKSMLSRISEFVDQKSQLEAHGVWLMSTEEIVQAMAEHYPNELLETVEKLVGFWKKGVFIGSPKKIFEAFGLVSEEKQKAETRIKFQRLYNSMKELNPKLEKVEF